MDGDKMSDARLNHAVAR